MGPHVAYYPDCRPRIPRERSFAANGVLGMAIFLMAETMFFAGLISAYLVLRSGFGAWPPPGQPRLPWEATACSTFLLLMSAPALFLTRHFAGRGQWVSMRRAMSVCLALGSGFLLVQGYEWTRLIGFGLGAESGIYGGTFYLLIGCHALHVFAGLAYLIWAAKSLGPRGSGNPRESLVPAMMYWSFVVALWPVLYGVVYF